MEDTGLKGKMPKRMAGVDTSMKVEYQGEVPLCQVLGTNVPNAQRKVTARGRGAMERQLPTKIA
jgi:hypothetical protein